MQILYKGKVTDNDLLTLAYKIIKALKSFVAQAV